eukprot:2239938-Alexandrium_andersonii.AAC.1
MLRQESVVGGARSGRAGVTCARRCAYERLLLGFCGSVVGVLCTQNGLTTAGIRFYADRDWLRHLPSPVTH